jgi:hypothetical protein
MLLALTVCRSLVAFHQLTKQLRENATVIFVYVGTSLIHTGQLVQVIDESSFMMRAGFTSVEHFDRRFYQPVLVAIDQNAKSLSP